MLSYLHSFHAGCMADVHKHTLLIRMIEGLKADGKPLNVIDTHAGRGVYDLTSDHSQKTGEAGHGILKLMEEDLEILNPIKKLIGKLKPNHYPGSPKIIQMLTGKEDTIHLFERHSNEFKQLKNRFNLDSRIKFYETNSFMSASFGLSKDAQNLIMIDPSYELKNEYADVLDTVERLLKSSPNAVIMLWIPHLPKNYHVNLIEQLEADGKAKLSTFEFAPMNERSMYASTVAVWNAPEGIDLNFSL
ncbi:MAG: 23S rRNA (adenine(2030)-N(6))-methyltransferase RlmJ [Pseudomonadota bacterium]|nr:23S rRNA (adenine(2030)-N(6))-methyltransferase RlmJ [Pseudomonadota bacterium]